MDKRILLIFLLSLMFLPKASAAATLNFGQAAISANGEELILPVNLNCEQGQDISALGLDIIYDSSRLDFKQLWQGQLLTDSDKSATVSLRSPGIARIIIFGFNQNIIGEGNIIQGIFNIRAGASGSANFSIARTDACDPYAEGIPITGANYTVDISASQEQLNEGNEPAPAQTEEVAAAAASPTTEEADQALSESTEPAQTEQEQQQQQAIAHLSPVAVVLPEALDSPQQDITAELPQPPGEVVKPFSAEEQELTEWLEEEYQEYKEAATTSVKTELAQLPQPTIKVEPKQTTKIAKIEVQAKEIKRFLFWRVYKFELDNKNIQPESWELLNSGNFPRLMRLNREQGTIYGIAWGEFHFKSNFIITTADGKIIEAPCAFVIK